MAVIIFYAATGQIEKSLIIFDQAQPLEGNLLNIRRLIKLSSNLSLMKFDG